MSYEEVKAGELVAVVTFLEMHQPPTAPSPASDLSLRRLEPDTSAYRDLFRLVGERWLWFSRLVTPDTKLGALVGDRNVEVFAVTNASDRTAGMLELDFRTGGECKLAFVGLVPELAGRGHGRWLLAEALRLAWRDGVQRVHVHTCSLDHPAALGAYIRAGFQPYKRAIERFPDPRLLGILPRDCAPQVPLLGTDGCASPPPAS